LDTLKKITKTFPNSSGVYQFIDKQGVIIYIGKAKNLKKRVNSYFSKTQTGKTKMLVSRIADIKHIVVETETDALLLENVLIKKHQPKYNVMLKDDKTYPWICIKQEAFPRVFLTRQVIKDGSEYYGPYPSTKVARTLLDLIHQLYTIRSCKLNLSAENIAKQKFDLCLDYHIGICKAPCVGYQSESDYDEDIKQIRSIVKGDFKIAKQFFEQQMLKYAENLEFEKAQAVKEKLESLHNYQARSTVVNPSINNVEVYNIISDATTAYINFLQVGHGAVIRSHTLEIKKKLDETDKELLELAIVEIRQRFDLHTKEIYLPFAIDILDDIKKTIPQKGDKKRLMELSRKNAVYFRLEKIKQLQLTDPDKHVNRLMKQMKEDLHLSEEPRHIECFDNSNIQGTNPVAACIVFKNGKPAKKEYRHFNIKTVEGPNDFASMEEIIERRYKRLLDEKKPLPQLIIVDGGKGQLSSAVKSLKKLNLYGKIAIIGIAKRLEEIYYPNDSVPLYLDKKSETLRVIQKARDEAHRFGITFHRKKRMNSTLQTELTEIPGIGQQTALHLLQHFRSVKKVKEASLEQLIKIAGKNRATIIYNYLHQNEA
jgi:excinuclease ABC subunit C